MYIATYTVGALGSVTAGADLCSLARNKWQFSGKKPTTHNDLVHIFVEEQAENQAILLTGSKVAGTSDAIENLSPSFFPVATMGAECAAIISDLAWADKNLDTGYEWAYVTDSPFSKVLIFVSGVLNSSQTDANDPFADPLVISASCWDALYQQGMNH